MPKDNTRRPPEHPLAGTEAMAFNWRFGLLALSLILALAIGLDLKLRQVFAPAPPAAPAPPPAAPGAVELERLTTLGSARHPTLSADGRLAAWQVEDGSRVRLQLMKVHETSASDIGPAAADARTPALSRDGAWLAYRQDGPEAGIYVLPIAGGEARRVAASGFAPAWSPDGKQLAFSTEEADASRAGASQIVVVQVEGGATRVLVEQGDALSPAWSPDGSRIAYATGGANPDILTIPAAGGTPVAVARDASVDATPAWSDDGRFVYFASDRLGRPSLWRVPVEGATGRVLGVPEAVTLAGSCAAEEPSIGGKGLLVAYVETVRGGCPDPAAPGGVRQMQASDIWLLRLAVR